MPARDWPEAVSWMRDERRHGDFRVLWLGESEVLPVAPRTSHGTAYAFTRDGAGDVRNAFVAPPGDGEPVVDDAIGLLSNRQTARFGHLVAPMGVRYVALVRRPAPDGGLTREFDPQIRASLGEQLDLAVVQAEPDMLLYENQAWAPVRATVPASTSLRAPGGDATAAALRAELQDAAPVSGPLSSSKVTKPGTLLFGDAYDNRWKASEGGSSLRHERAFGWSNAYRGATRGTVDLHFDGGSLRPLLLLLELALWVLAIVAWFRWRRRDRAARAGPAGITA
jgi:hypothetical protein